MTVPWGHRSVAAVAAGAGAVLCGHWCCHLRQAASGDGAGRWLIQVVLTSFGAVELTGQQQPQVLVVPLVAAYLIGQCMPREVGQCLPHKQCICC